MINIHNPAENKAKKKSWTGFQKLMTGLAVCSILGAPSCSNKKPAEQTVPADYRPSKDTAFGVDMSHNNQKLDIKKLAQRNTERISDGREETIPVRFMYLRTSYGCKDKKYPIDANLHHNINTVNTYNDTCNTMEKIHVGFYFFYIPSQDPKEQAEYFIKTVEDLGDVKRDLIPMLDVEKIGKGQKSKELQKDVKIWLDIVEKHFGVKPGIYAQVTFYETYLDCPNFSEYKKRLAAYSREKRINGNHVTGNTKTYYDVPIIQWAEDIKIPGTGNKEGCTDAIDTYHLRDLLIDSDAKDMNKIEIKKPKPIAIINKPIAVVDKPTTIDKSMDKGPFDYLGKAHNGKHIVYKYVIKNGGNYGGILKQFKNNGGKIDGTKVVSATRGKLTPVGTDPLEFEELDKKTIYLQGTTVFVLEPK